MSINDEEKYDLHRVKNMYSNLHYDGMRKNPFTTKKDVKTEMEKRHQEAQEKLEKLAGIRSFKKHLGESKKRIPACLASIK